MVVTLHQGHLYVANFGSDEITVYPGTAAGDASPVRRIAGASTGLDGPSGVVVIDGKLFVTNWNSNSVTVLPATGAGDLSPTATIQGAATQLFTPWGLDGPKSDALIFAEGFESGSTEEWSEASIAR